MVNHLAAKRADLAWFLVLSCFLFAVLITCSKSSPNGPNDQDQWAPVNDGLASPHVQFLAVHPLDSDIVFAGTWDGLYRSLNSAGSWIRVDSGWTYTQIAAVAFDSQDNQAVYAGTQGAGLFRSEDGGQSWEPKNVGLQDCVIYGIAPDPLYPDTLFVSTEDGIYRSYDGADTLTKVHWLPRAFLAINPQNPQVIYTGGKWNQLVKSTDGGESWSNPGEAQGLPSGGPAVKINWILIDPNNPQVLYAASSNYGIHKSENSGQTWSDVTDGLGALDVSVLVMNASGSIIYAATDRGVAESKDGGQSWQKINSGLSDLDVKALAVSPQDSPILYAGTWETGVFKRPPQ